MATGSLLTTAAVVVAACASCAAIALPAAASDYRLDGREIAQRGGPTSYDHGFWGPEFRVGGAGKASTDYYYCPGYAPNLSNWIVVGDELDSRQYGIDASSNAYADDNPIPIRVWNLGWDDAYLRAAISCTNDSTAYPYVDPQYGSGDYQDYWDKQFTGTHHRPSINSYKGLIPRAFCWDLTNPGCPVSVGSSAGIRARVALVRARKGGNRFALRNGTNRISLAFKHLGRQRPPAVRLAGARRCAARGMQLAVHNGSGNVRLVLRCGGLKRGAAARVRISKAIVRHFRLRQGSGTLRIHLDKPRGSVKPYAHVSYGRGTPCRNVRRRLRMRSREFDVRIAARCGRVARKATGHLYVGGLLADR